MKIEEIFKKCQDLTIKKRADYTSQPLIDSHENFKRSAEIASWSSRNEDKPYLVLIGTKLTRLCSLLSSGKPPHNESIEDNFLDLINYCALWMERSTNEKIIRDKIDIPYCRWCGITFSNKSEGELPKYKNAVFCDTTCLDKYLRETNQV